MFHPAEKKLWMTPPLAKARAVKNALSPRETFAIVLLMTTRRIIPAKGLRLLRLNHA
jgi:hypothetical protein